MTDAKEPRAAATSGELSPGATVNPGDGCADEEAPRAVYDFVVGGARRYGHVALAGNVGEWLLDAVGIKQPGNVGDVPELELPARDVSAE